MLCTLHCSVACQWDLNRKPTNTDDRAIITSSQMEMPPKIKKGRPAGKGRTCKALAKANDSAVAMCSECRRLKAKKPCHRIRLHAECGCGYCGSRNTQPTQPPATPTSEVPLAPRTGHGTCRSASIFEGHDASGRVLYSGDITDSARKARELQAQRRKQEYEQARPDNKEPKRSKMASKNENENETRSATVSGG